MSASRLLAFLRCLQKALVRSRNFTAEILVPSDAEPKFCKQHPIPFASVDLVTQEILRLPCEDILVPVKTAKWAAPIEHVQKKKNGTIRICGDFKQTVKAVLLMKTYPVPRAEELWAAMSGGQKFTKLDLRDAY